MKIIKNYILILVFIVMIFLINKQSSVYAQEQIGTLKISEDCIIKDVDFEIKDINQAYAIHITDNANVLFENVTITCLNSVVDMQDIFRVDNGAFLTLNNVVIKSMINSQYGINNEGVINLNCANFANAKTQTTIYNNSVVEDSIILNSVNPGDIDSIILSEGYVTVHETSNINGTIDIELSTPYQALNDDYIGRVLVKGRNTYANYYMNHFNYVGAPCEADLIRASQQNSDPFLILKDKIYMDYVGIIGDDLNVANDGFEVNAINGINILESGDLILTKFSIYTNERLSDGSLNKIVFAGKYATANLFLKYNPNYLSYKVKAYLLTEDETSGIVRRTSQSVITSLDNITTFAGSPTGGVSTVYQETLYQDTLITMKVYNNDFDLVDEKEIITSKNSQIASFVDLNSFEFDYYNIASNNISIDILNNSLQFVCLNIKVSENATKEVINVYLKPVTIEPKELEIKVDNQTSTYNSQNQINNFKPYYINEEEIVYLENSEYRFLNSENEEVKEIINAGKYNLIIESSNENIVYLNNEFEIEILPAKLNINLNTDFVYDGTIKSVTGELVGVLNNDDCEVIFSNNERIIPGSQTVEIALSNSNYYLDNYRCELFVDKATIDMSKVEFNDVVGVYDPNIVYTAEVNFVPEGVEVKYLNNSHTNVNVQQGYHSATATFYVIDTNLYYPITNNIMYAKITITPQIIDISTIQFPEINHVYDGSYVEAKITSELPEQISNVVYSNNIQKDASDIPYEAKAKFVIKQSYINNYKIEPLEIKTKIYISKADVDLNQIIYEDLVVEYDGNEHIIEPFGIDPNILNFEYKSSSQINAGEYIQNIKLILLDTKNYNPIPENQIELTAKLKILKKITNVSNLIFESVSYNYENEHTYKLEVQGIVPDYLAINYEYFLDNNLVASGSDCSVSQVGEYKVVAEFNFLQDEVDNYEPISNMEAKLIILPKEIDCKNVLFENKIVTYDGQEHSIYVENLPENLNVIYSGNNFVDAGIYTIEAQIVCSNSNYVLINNQIFSANLTILQAEYDMSNISFDDLNTIYDGQVKRVEIVGNLPDGVTIKEYINNERKNVGTSNASVSFSIENKNYKPVENLYCEINISPKPITISLEKSIFTYTGEPITVSAYASGVVGEDNINISLNGNTKTNAGVYFAQVISVGNDNYIVENNILKYEITKAQIDLSTVSFNDIEVTYNGKEHSPLFNGNLPEGVSVNIVKQSMINVGEYVVYAEFSVINPNYIAPNRLKAEVVILPRPILIEFSNYTNILEDGQTHEINVNFIGLVDENFQGYKIIYNKTPIIAGQYIAKVELNENSNYVIYGVDTLTFEILTDTKTYINENLEITVKGDGFSESSKINLESINEDIIEKEIYKINSNIKNFDCFKIKIDDEENQKDIKVSLKVNTLDLNNSDYIKVYTLKNGQLQEIDFVIDRNVLEFDAHINVEIVIIEENTFTENNLILIVSLLFICLISLITILVLINKYSNKRKKTTINFIDVN